MKPAKIGNHEMSASVKCFFGKIFPKEIDDKRAERERLFIKEYLACPWEEHQSFETNCSLVLINDSAPEIYQQHIHCGSELTGNHWCKAKASE